MSIGPIQICPEVKNFDWGNFGTQSLIGRLLSDSAEGTPYAELWFGTHPKGPAAVPSRKQNLREFLASAGEEVLAASNVKKWGQDLSFLAKILSVRTGLSIQSHPSKELAKVLHRKDPANYPDENAKPEASVALTQVELLSGFRSANEIRDAARRNPEFRALLSEQTLNLLSSGIASEAECIRGAFAEVMQAHPALVAQQSDALVKRLSAQPTTSAEEQWILELSQDYPGDPGLFCFYLLNYLVLEPGESMFIDAGIVHAYLSGDMVECMAASDNVVRAGLTPKFRDVKTLLEMACYEHQPKKLVVPRRDSKLGWLQYTYPAEEFGIAILDTPVAGIDGNSGRPEIWFCLEDTDGALTVNGEQFLLRDGMAYFMPASLQLYELRLTRGKVVRTYTP